MKTAFFRSLRLDPQLRAVAEDLLDDGETLDSFVDQALRAHIERRQYDHAFFERGLASRDEVLRELDELLAQVGR